MHYFSHISFTYTSNKNKLFVAVLEFLQSQDRIVIQAHKVGDFKSEIIHGIQKLNSSHPNCNPFKPYWYEGQKKNDYNLVLGSGSVCNFHIYASK